MILIIIVAIINGTNYHGNYFDGIANMNSCSHNSDSYNGGALSVSDIGV